MSELAFGRLVGLVAGGQNDRTELFAVGIELQDVLFALVIFKEGFVQLLGIELLAGLVHLHLIRNGIRHVEFDLLAGFLEGHRKITRLTGQTGHHGVGPHGDIAVVVQFGDPGIDGWCRQAVIRESRQLLAPVARLAAEFVFLLHDGDVVAGLGRIDGG